MCGIIGILADFDVAPHLVEALKRLEYRGYDSAGVATLVNGRIERRRAEGKLVNLERRLGQEPLPGHTGIGHTRWATHGVPNETNAHPHATDRVAIVHNGIIENFRTLREELAGDGRNFATETDSEVIAHLITRYLEQGLDPVAAAGKAIKRLEGAFALGIIFSGEHDLMIGARLGSPLAVGWGEGEMFLGSDALALAPMTERISYLEEGDWAVLRRAGAVVYDAQDREVRREVKRTALSGSLVDRGNHRHFMLKEIHEQPVVLGDTIRPYFNPLERTIELPDLPFDLAAVSKVTLVACGTSYYAAMVAKYWFEQIARLPADVDLGSEFRYREPPLEEGGLALFISQSGETADTLAALRFCKGRGQHLLGIVNAAESTLSREADTVLMTHAGPEIGVASTKAFTCQLATLACFVIATAKARGAIDRAQEAALSTAVTEVPSRAAEVLNNDTRLRALAHDLFKCRDVLYIGRGTSFPIALEGALKLKEISYIHAEGYAAGELKHGPIALIDENVPVIVVAPSGELFEKSVSNMHEVVTRDGRVVLLSDAKGIAAEGAEVWATIELPDVHPFVAPILYAIPVQLLAYHIAVLKGTDVDQPRNLAKSVTVE
ncbi:MAG: glutamine--fructose-6-phosphate transaminase (isomerizing) [Alphaproteobacteria bacterium]